MDRVDFVHNLHLTPDTAIVSISHSSDSDGHMCGNVLKTYFRSVYHIGVNYGKPCNYSAIPPGSTIFITDFSLPVEEMRNLVRFNTVIWIDHHEVYKNPEYDEFKELEGIRSTECSAAKLTWQYIYPDQNVPDVIEYVSDYDTWKFKYPESMPFNYALNLFNILPRYSSDVIIRKLLYNKEFVDTLVNSGRRICDYVDKKNKILCGDCGFKTEIDGHKAVAINIRNCNSTVLDPLKDKDYTLGITFGYNSTIANFRCSLYTDDPTIDCNVIANKFGGGGHKGAAGFTSSFDKLPFILPTHNLKEPDSKDIVSELNELHMADPLIYRHAVSALSGLMRRQGYPCTFEGKKAWCCNHPYWIGDMFYDSNAIMDYELCIFWNFTNTGWFRYRIYPMEKNHCSLEDLVHQIPGGKIVGKAIWCYREKPIENEHPEMTVQSFNPKVPSMFNKNNNY